MFQVQKTLISDDVALAKFSCHLSSCKGACCVVGEGGAPIEKHEINHLNKAYDVLKNELPATSIKEVESNGLIRASKDGLELACVGSAECVFVIQANEKVSICAIQKAFFDGRIDWEKPISCHLFPIRIMNIGDLDFLNFEFVPEICTPGAEMGQQKNEFLAEHLERPLVRKYGNDWFDEFIHACNHVRNQHPSPV